jgi:hypothetical protein
MPEDRGRALLEAELREAEDRVAQGERDICRLSGVFAKLQRLGIDNTPTNALDSLRRSQVLFIDERDRLRRALGRWLGERPCSVRFQPAGTTFP